VVELINKRLNIVCWDRCSYRKMAISNEQGLRYYGAVAIVKRVTILSST